MKREKVDDYCFFPHENINTTKFHQRCFPPLPWPWLEVGKSGRAKNQSDSRFGYFAVLGKNMKFDI